MTSKVPTTFSSVADIPLSAVSYQDDQGRPCSVRTSASWTVLTDITEGRTTHAYLKEVQVRVGTNDTRAVTLRLDTGSIEMLTALMEGLTEAIAALRRVEGDLNGASRGRVAPPDFN